MTGEDSLRRVRAFDPAAVVPVLARELPGELEYLAAAPGGQVGAAFARWAGREAVLTWRPGTDVADEHDRERVVRAARERGAQAPGWFHPHQVGPDVVVLQERLPGEPVEQLSVPLLEGILETNSAMRGALAGVDDIHGMPLYLTGSGPGFCLHEPLRRYSRRTHRLLDWIEEVGRAHAQVLTGDDAVHGDYHPGNILAQGQLVTGVIDWDAACRSDGRFDLVTLRFGAHGLHCDPGVIDRLDGIVDQIPDGVRRVSWAHMSLRMTDWAIRHFTDSDVAHWLALAESRMGA